MNNFQNSQAAFTLIQQLASLAATPNISEDNLKFANQNINGLLEKVVKPAIQDLTALASGLIVK